MSKKLSANSYSDYSALAHALVRTSNGSLPTTGSGLLAAMARAKGFDSPQAFKASFPSDGEPVDLQDSDDTCAFCSEMCDFFLKRGDAWYLLKLPQATRDHIFYMWHLLHQFFYSEEKFALELQRAALNRFQNNDKNYFSFEQLHSKSSHLAPDYAFGIPEELELTAEVLIYYGTQAREDVLKNLPKEPPFYADDINRKTIERAWYLYFQQSLKHFAMEITLPSVNKKQLSLEIEDPGVLLTPRVFIQTKAFREVFFQAVIHVKEYPDLHWY